MTTDDAREYAQGIWDMLRALGYDTDGDPGPAATIAGMGGAGFIAMAIETAAEIRADHEADYDAIESERDRLRSMVAALESEIADGAGE